MTVGEVALCAHRDASGVRPSDQELAGLELLDQRMQRVWPGDEAQEEELGGANLVHVMGGSWSATQYASSLRYSCPPCCP